MTEKTVLKTRIRFFPVIRCCLGWVGKLIRRRYRAAQQIEGSLACHHTDRRRLLGAETRCRQIERGEETDEDLSVIFSPGSSLGGARPKASVLDQNGELYIAKFPKEVDDYSIETWEGVAMNLARQAGIEVPEHRLEQVNGKTTLLSRRFDREAEQRIPYLSALSMMDMRDGEQGSYPELVDQITRQGARAKKDSAELYRRVAFNVLISNVDDHLRNHGFLWSGPAGWLLSPAFDLNPVPTDLKPRILSTNINLDEATCAIDLVRSAADLYGLSLGAADEIIRKVATSVRNWRKTAAVLGAKPSEIERLSSAFEHEDLKLALQV
jgi:serine/threonine-protein kinase HipA